MRRLLSLAFLTVLALAACSPNDESETATSTDPAEEAAPSDETSTDDSESTTPAATTSSAVADFASSNVDGRPTIEIADGAPDAPDGLLISDLVVGEGAAVEPGNLIEVHYAGVTLADGAEFDASWNRNESFFVPIGVGGLIAGWDQGLIGATEGSRRLLVIPPALAYGDAGAGGVIAPGASLVFVVDVLQIVDTPAPEIPDISEATAELQLIDVTVGEGTEVVSGDRISVNYQGSLLDGTIFDSSWDRGEPFTTNIGVGQVIQGWDEGMVGMREGGRRILVIPSDLAYGESGAGALIGPNTPLVFVVDLLRVHS